MPHAVPPRSPPGLSAPDRACCGPVGFATADFDKPIIGIAMGTARSQPATSASRLDRSRAWFRAEAGAFNAAAFGTITVQRTGHSNGTEGMKYSLVSPRAR